MTDENGIIWLKTPSGWLVERMSILSEPSLMPATVTALCGAVEQDSSPFTVNIRPSNVTKRNSDGKNRQILSLQAQLNDMGAAITKIQESMVLAQCLISRLLDGNNVDFFNFVVIYSIEFLNDYFR